MTSMISGPGGTANGTCNASAANATMIARAIRPRVNFGAVQCPVSLSQKFIAAETI